MTSKGQLTIPKEVRDALKLDAGTRSHVTVRDGKVVAMPKNGKLPILRACWASSSGEVLTIEEMREAVMDVAAQDDERISRESNEAGVDRRRHERACPVSGR
jgi:AbrB family looped-hinge helix DNA binding protein